jgi:tetraprenyl-beta-curcumene synthase
MKPWWMLACTIPDGSLRAQALSSLSGKQFHCEGGAVLAGPSRDPEGHVLKFLVPYQILCDYLDTVTDRGPSQDPTNLRCLHQALQYAISPGAEIADIYQWHPDRDDGGFAKALIEQCQRALMAFPGLDAIRPAMGLLVDHYITLQVLKHGPTRDRVNALQQWYASLEGSRLGLQWWEFAAGCGSTLGLFALLTAALKADLTAARAERLYALYFPWMGALHILLDYYIDQAEDLAGGDLNFVTYYPSPKVATRRLQDIFSRTLEYTHALPDGLFHRYVAQGLLGFYLADRKVGYHLAGLPWRLLSRGGLTAWGVWAAAHRGRAP